MKRAVAVFALALPPAIVACSFLRSLDGYSDKYGLDASDDVDARCPGCRTPDVFAKDQSKPHGVVVTPTLVIWTNEGDGTVMSCTLEGCGAKPTVLATKQPAPTEIVLGGDGYVYWISRSSNVAFCVPATCQDLPLYAPGPADAGSSMGVAATRYAFWTTQGGAVLACPGCPSPFGAAAITLAADQPSPRGIVVAVRATQTMPIWGTNGAVMACSNAACNDGGAVPFAAGQGQVDRLALDAQNVYWTSDGSIRSCPLDGCQGAPVTIADGQQPNALALDGANVYWTNGDDTVRSCPIAGCPAEGPATLAVDQNDPQGIAVTPTGDVYWASRGNGQILRLATKK